MVTLFEKPLGVVINKCLEGDNPAEDFCLDQEIKILAKLPYDQNLAFLNSIGKILVKESESYKNLFTALLEKVRKELADERTSHS